jgi:hypothetical protein
MQERIHAVQVWADYLDELRSDAQPVHLKAA